MRKKKKHFRNFVAIETTKLSDTMKKLLLTFALMAVAAMSANANIYKGTVRKMKGCDAYENCTDWMTPDVTTYLTIDDKAGASGAYMKITVGGSSTYCKITHWGKERYKDENGWDVIEFNATSNGLLEECALFINPQNPKEFVVTADESDGSWCGMWVK